eukprot:2876758-Amphidinium_carterae.2
MARNSVHLPVGRAVRMARKAVRQVPPVQHALFASISTEACNTISERLRVFTDGLFSSGISGWGYLLASPAAEINDASLIFTWGGQSSTAYAAELVAIGEALLHVLAMETGPPID